MSGTVVAERVGGAKGLHEGGSKGLDDGTALLPSLGWRGILCMTPVSQGSLTQGHLGSRTGHGEPQVTCRAAVTHRGCSLWPSLKELLH